VLSGSADARVAAEFEARIFWFQGVYQENEKIKIRCATQEKRIRLSLLEKFDPATIDRKSGDPDRLEIGEVAKVTVRTDGQWWLTLSRPFPRWDDSSSRKTESRWEAESSSKRASRCSPSCEIT